jgi:uncharacterized protein YecE (DUF72 family)
MKFGRIDTSLLANTDMSLPPEPSSNAAVLGGVKAASPHIYLGCTQWKCDAWLGKIYPENIRDNEILEAYIRQFNCIEMNAMHYRIFPPATVAKWAAKAVDRDFKFCPKFPQSISHYSNFSNAGLQTEQFLESLAPLGAHLGPSFLQVSDGFTTSNEVVLLPYLQALAERIPVFLEVRHEQWFSFAQMQQTASLLTERGIGWVITDAPGRRDVCHMHLTTKTAFIRFLGNNLHPTDFTRIDAWIQRIKYWLDNGLESLYFFMHHPDEDGAPELIDYMAQRLQLQTGMAVKRPVFLPRQATLFG